MNYKATWLMVVYKLTANLNLGHSIQPCNIQGILRGRGNRGWGDSPQNLKIAKFWGGTFPPKMEYEYH
jgi:hypothetical protein